MPAHIRPLPRSHGGFFSILIGVIGELLITAGVVLGLFVVWQLWWTDIEANQVQAQIVQDLDQDFIQPEDPQKVAVPGEGDPPIITAPEKGVAFATMYVPRFSATYEEPITQGGNPGDVGITKSLLDAQGIGHYPDSQMLGEMGNFALAAHRTTYGKPFAQVDELVEGDAIVVRTAETWYVYRVTSHEIVQPEDYQVIYPIPRAESPTVAPDNRYITLTSCHPKYSAKQRYIVYGTLAYWAPVSSGVPQELLDGGVTLEAEGTAAKEVQ